jgi:hypothetical protein
MITHGISLSAKQSFLLGLHQPNDIYKIALYKKDAKIGPELKHYTGSGEVSGKGYSAGGIELKGFNSGTVGKSAFITFEDVKIDRASFVAHGAVIYNASKNDEALCVLNFGSDRHVSDGTFELKFPKPTETQALILLS